MRKKRQQLTQQGRTELFQQYRPLARKLAGRFAKKFNIVYADMLEEAEGILALVVCRWSEDSAWGYDPTSCNPTSWIYRAIYWELVTLYTRKQERATAFSVLTKDDSTRLQFANKPQRWIETLLQTLGEDARILVATIVAAPADIVEDIMPNAPSRSRKAVERHLRGSLGWAEGRFTAAWAEVKVAL